MENGYVLLTQNFLECHSEPCHTGLRSGINKKSVILDSESLTNMPLLNRKESKERIFSFPTHSDIMSFW
ncbi:MAG: hypothetical protein LBQ59_05385 [Candidatus Peribacteria bacterium]|nr:hypothetical protein [Candidatus Peribacteria bacterium]